MKIGEFIDVDRNTCDKAFFEPDAIAELMFIMIGKVRIQNVAVDMVLTGLWLGDPVLPSLPCKLDPRNGFFFYTGEVDIE